jgi:crossover junction endodeoxyribonuclease RuvC
MRILGIDPGTRVVGYGVVDLVGNRMRPVAHGVIRADMAHDYGARLRSIHDGLARVIVEHRPDQVAIEEAFYGKNAASALRMGEGRGVAILAAALHDRPLFQYTPAEVKKAVVGNGRAHKEQIQEMVRLLLGLPEIPEPEDAADALAVAICHCNRRTEV